MLDITAIRAVIEEMTATARSDSDDEDGPWSEWTSANRDQVDKWQARLRDALAEAK